MDNNYFLRNNIHVYAEMEKQPDSVTTRQRQNQMLSKPRDPGFRITPQRPAVLKVPAVREDNVR